MNLNREQLEAHKQRRAQQREQIIETLKSDPSVTYARIAKQHGVSVSLVARYAHENGVWRVPGPKKKEAANG